MNKSIKIFIAIFSIAIIGACTKKHIATITISAPTEMQTFNKNDTVKIVGTISSDAEMHGYTVNIKYKTDNTVAFTKTVHEHEATYTVNEYWVNNVSATNNLSVEIIAETDHEGETTTKSVNIHCDN